ncbi:MAG: SsrA-binding protein SmpB [Candidatus Peregrinibacteria bacterium]
MKIIHKNKKAYFDYEVLEELTAGIMLTGSEIKSIRAGNVNLKSAYVSIQNGEAFLQQSQIAQYAYDSSPNYDPFRTRKLLLSKREIEWLAGKLNTQGVTIAALAVGLKGPYAKIVIGLVRGKKKHDKRQLIKERHMEREAERAMKKF